MVKSNQPLQIRLTEPVIFLKGPSTGLDFRGRPQPISGDSQPAQLRGLLTLRLSKPTRIRKVEIKLEGKARTEWPEGIGSRKTDTSEEHVIILDSTTYFNAYENKEIHPLGNRRSASVGPGVSAGQWDVGEDELEDNDLEVINTPGVDGTPDDWAEVTRRGRGPAIGSGLPRSASAVPGSNDFGSWQNNGHSRRPSGDNDEGLLQMRDLSVRDRGPSPAYTPRPDNTPPGPSSRRNSIRGGSALSSRDPTLSPIMSAPNSRGTSDRDGSTSTERRRATSIQLPRSHLSQSALNELAPPDEAAAEAVSAEATEDAPAPAAAAAEPTSGEGEKDEKGEETTVSHPPSIRPSILESAGHRHSSGEVRFATAAATFEPESSPLTTSPEITATRPSEPVSNRAASVRSMASQFSVSTASLTDQHMVNEMHPVVSAIQTAYNTPAPSAPPSIRAHSSTDDLPLPNSDNSAPPTTNGDREMVSSNSTSASNSINESRRSSLRETTTASSSNPQSPIAASSAQSIVPPPGPPNQELRQGRKSRIGSSSTIVINNDHPGPSRPTSLADHRQNSDSSRRSASGHHSLASAHNQSHSRGSVPPSREHSPDGRSRHSKFSLSSAFGAVKERMGSKSRSRAGSRVPRSRAPSFNSESTPPPSISGASGSASASMVRGDSGTGTPRTPTGSAIPSYLRDEEDRRGRRDGRAHSKDDNPVPFGRGGASRDGSRSRDRTVSPSRKRDDQSPHRGRGRNKGIKGLTDALGLGEHHHEEEGEDIHNWKEFKKGVYNYPISFAIPVDAPPTLHAEFGSVAYRLKATVVRVGALTPNLVEDIEVITIASPQEDDLEESENVIVERQWEEQMRYQIALSGKAFPIGGMIPISIRLMPLMKCKIHRLTVALEEKTDYYAQERKVTRHETPRKFMLLFVKQPEKYERIYPLLPIVSEDVNAAKDSPLAQMAAQAAVNNPAPDSFDPDNEDSMYATLLDPMGPWHLEKSLQIPDCTSAIKFTSKHEKTNITVGHWLKVTIRVERGDDVAVDSKGRRKQFDIIIETPIKILDCRVNPQWNSLPTYSPHNPGAVQATPGICSVHGNNKHQAPITSSRNAPDSLVSAAPASRGGYDHQASSASARDNAARSRSRDRLNHSGHHQEHEDTLLERNIVYDRLMSGQETEMGEVPPTYGEAVAMAIRSASRSASRSGTEGVALPEVGNLRSESSSRSRSRLRGDVSR